MTEIPAAARDAHPLIRSVDRPAPSANAYRQEHLVLGREIGVRHQMQKRIHYVMDKFMVISVGAILGANARYWVGGWVVDRLGTTFPYGNLIINLTGSLILGFFVTLVTDRFLVDPRWRLLVAIGFLGSYTTFSSYTYESVDLILKGQAGLGLLNLFGSSILGAAAAVAGIMLGRTL